MAEIFQNFATVEQKIYEYYCVNWQLKC